MLRRPIHPFVVSRLSFNTWCPRYRELTAMRDLFALLVRPSAPSISFPSFLLLASPFAAIHLQQCIKENKDSARTGVSRPTIKKCVAHHL